MNTPLVDLRNLTKRYPGLTALSDVTLAIEPGEIFALLGRNGAGKTTLIGIVSGLVKRTSGEVRVAGFDVEKDYLQTRRLIGLVPQEINYDPFFSVEEVLRFQAGYFGVHLTDERLMEILGALGLADKRRSNTRDLSGGMKRRLLIAKALVHDPKVLFLDEPTAGVDVELRRDLWDYVRRLRAGGTTVVLTTHYLEEAEELADRVGIIDAGQLRLVERKDALLARMGERVLIVRLGQRIDVLPDVIAAIGGTLVEEGDAVSFTGRGNEDLGPKLDAVVAAGLVVRDVETRSSRLEDILVAVLREGGAS